NKINQFVMNPILRATIGQLHNTLDARQVMHGNKILLCRFSKGRLGEDVASLLGSLLVSMISLAALEREAIPPHMRRPHKLYADEVQNFVHGVDFPTILAEARKYKLTLVIATQTGEQMPDVESVMGNCNTILTYRVSAKDAKRFE